MSNVNVEVEQREIDDFDDDNERFPANQNEGFHYMDYISKKE